MRSLLPTFGKTILLYGAAWAALYASDRLNPSASDAGIGQSLLVLGAVGLVLAAAVAYSFYKAVAQSPQWWAVVGLHAVLCGVSLVVLAR